MARSIAVTLDNGERVQYTGVPESVTPEQILERVGKEYAGRGVTEVIREPLAAGRVGTERGRGTNLGEAMSLPPKEVPPQESGVLSTVKGLGSDLLRGFGRGASFLAEGAAAFNDTQSAFGRKAQPRNYNELSQAVSRVLSTPDPSTEGSGRKYLRSGLEAIGSGAALPLGGFGPVMQAGNFFSGVGSEAAANALGDAPHTRLLGSLVGGYAGTLGGMKFAQRARPNAITLAREAVEGISPKNFSDAQAFQATAAKEGATLDLVQALEAVGAKPGTLSGLRDAVASSSQGNRLQQVLREQPTELELLSEKFVGTLPGQARAGDIAANAVQDASTARITLEKQARSAAAGVEYAKAGNLSTAFRTDFADILSKTLSRPGIPADAAVKVKEALNRLKKAPGTGAKMEHAADYDQLIRDLAGPYKGQPLTSSGNVFIGDLTKQLKGILRVASPETEKAAAIYAQRSQDFVDPLKRGLVGTFATPRGALPDRAANQQRFTTLLDRGETPGTGVSNIRDFEKELRKVDPQAFPDAFKTYLKTKLGESLDAAPSTTISTENLAESLHSKLFANRNQFNGLRQAVSAVAEGSGMKPAEIADTLRGLDNFATITRALRSKPAGRVGLSSGEIKQVGEQSRTATALNTLGLIPFGRAAAGIRKFRYGQTLKTFDEILTSPEGARKLAELGRQKLGTRQALEAFASLGTAPAAVQKGMNPPGITEE